MTRTRGPASAHFDLVDERAYATVRTTLALLEETGAQYVLAGGWAAYAYGTRVPSVDTDVFVGRKTATAIRDRLRTAPPVGLDAQQLDLLDLDGRNVLLGADPEMGVPETGYVPAEVLAGRVVRRRLPLPDGSDVEAPVPAPRELAFMKLKAYFDRSLGWRALREPAVMASLAPTDRAGVREKDVSYYYRKAGKDLYDLAFLCAGPTSLDEVLALAAAQGLGAELRQAVEAPPFPLVAFARDAASSQPEAQAWLDRFG